jgi:uncharacterized membrane protein YedE/YeeE
MTRSAARSVANVVLISAGVAAAYVVITRPPLRRLAVNGLRWWLGASIPAYLTSQVRDAWVQSARPFDIAQGRPERLERRTP